MQNTTMIELPERVKEILDTIMEAGYEAYAVGGCIRDSILGRKPNDWDITTSASPYEIKELFRLFPGKPAKKIAYIAGRPKPRACV